MGDRRMILSCAIVFPSTLSRIPSSLPLLLERRNKLLPPIPCRLNDCNELQFRHITQQEWPFTVLEFASTVSRPRLIVRIGGTKAPSPLFSFLFSPRDCYLTRRLLVGCVYIWEVQVSSRVEAVLLQFRSMGVHKRYTGC